MSSWVKVLNSMPAHPKFVMAGDRAAWLFVCGLCYSNEHLTDGFIATHTLPVVAPGVKAPEKLAAALVAAGLWHPEQGGWRIHDYAGHQRTADDIRESRSRDADRKATARLSARSPRGQNPDSGRTPPECPDGVRDVEKRREEKRREEPSSQAQKVARRRARQPVDQSQLPDEFPAELEATVAECLSVLRRAWQARGGIEPQSRGVGLAVLRNPRADHRAVAAELEHWLTAGKGQRARCEDIAKRFGDWTANAHAQRPATNAQVLPLSRRDRVIAEQNDWQNYYPSEGRTA